MTRTACMDIETMSVKSRARILSMGICFFDNEKIQTFEEIRDAGIEIFFNQECQENRHVQSSTLTWWNEPKQQASGAARVFEAVAEHGITPREFHDVYNAWLEKQDISPNWVTKYCRWFTRGPHFDVSLIDSLFEDHGVSSPWKFFMPRDVRTLLEERGVPRPFMFKQPEGFIYHNALHDAAFDAWMMQQAKFVAPKDWDLDDETNARMDQA